MSTDKKTIGITGANGGALAGLTQSGRFLSELDAAKFAMAYAIREGAAIGRTEGAETKWNVGSLDPDGSLAAMVEAFFPQVQEPYRQIEFLMNEGLKLLAPKSGHSPDVFSILANAAKAATR